MRRAKAIVLITCDELTREALSFCGNEAVRTRNLDRLCETSTEFERMYTTSPWCLPARCSMATGRYPHQNGAYSNFRPCPLDAGAPNLFQLLKKEGYYTAMCGKCHFAPVPYGQTRPDVTLPYDEFKAYYESLGIDHLELEDDKQVSVWFYDDYSKELDAAGYLKDYRDAVWNREYQKVFPFPGPAGWHPDAWVGRKTVEFLKSYDAEQPLFAWVSFSGPHYTIDAPEEYLRQVDTENLPRRKRKPGELDGTDRIQHDSYVGGKNANVDVSRSADGNACKNYSEEYWKRFLTSYCANVKLIDDQIGEILSAVYEKYGEDALILFTADHGEMMGSHGLWGKHNCAYEEVWHIPLLVRYPGEAAPIADKRLVNSTDLLPTCLAAAGVPIPECDGKDLGDPKWEREYTFAEGEGFLAVTDGTRKYIHVQKGTEQGREFLDLSEDPEEFENRIGRSDCQEALSVLRNKAIEHLLPSLLA